MPNAATEPSLDWNSIVAEHEDLSSSVYEVAAVSLAGSPHQDRCIDWLLQHRNDDGTWGASATLCWHDRYVCTYAAATALKNVGIGGGLVESALQRLPEIAAQASRLTKETLTFGGLIDALDRFSRAKGEDVVAHAPVVESIVAEERSKWQRMAEWEGFYNPSLSIAGYCGERIYADDRISVERFITAFQVANGSISNVPGASALVLLEAERRSAASTAAIGELRAYVHALDPYQKVIPCFDYCPHFVTAWALMFLSELGVPYERLGLSARRLQAEEMHDHLQVDGVLRRLCVVGLTTIPGDADSTACALLASTFAGLEVPNIDELEALFREPAGHYLSFLYERDPSVTTNIHMAAVLAQRRSPRLVRVLEWLDEQARSPGGWLCKWHLSPFYSLGEAARVLARIQHPLSQSLALEAAELLLGMQQPNGGWGIDQATTEETGYAILGLAAVFDGSILSSSDTKRRIHASLLRAAEAIEQIPVDFPALWIGKSLYCVKPLVPLLRQVCLKRVRGVASAVS